MREAFWWILGGGLVMSALALVGSLTLLVRRETLERWIKPLVALASGSLLGGALFHMLPTAMARAEQATVPFIWAAAGFMLFLVLDHMLHWWNHGHRQEAEKKPLGYLILAADGMHNFTGGLAVAGAFLVDIRVGLTAWVAAAAHEVPQELGDFGILVHSGWSTRKALLLNLLSGLTFPVGGLLAYAVAGTVDVSVLVAFGAGNFIYIGAADLLPELKEKESWRRGLLHLSFFFLALGLLLALRLLFHGLGGGGGESSQGG